MMRPTTSEAMPELDEGHPDTWADTDPTPGIPEGLTVHPGLPLGERFRTLAQRHRLRAERARVFYAASRNPERGLPVAGNSAAWLMGTLLFVTHTAVRGHREV